MRVVLPDGVRATSATCGCAHTVVQTDLGLVFGWGSNNVGQLSGAVTELVAPSTPLQMFAGCTVSKVGTSLVADVYMCACTVGFSGTDCQFDVDECASKPCQNSANCTESSANPSMLAATISSSRTRLLNENASGWSSSTTPLATGKPRKRHRTCSARKGLQMNVGVFCQQCGDVRQAKPDRLHLARRTHKLRKTKRGTCPSPLFSWPCTCT